jgi:type VI secretion system secreted protein VgrG
MAEGHWRFYLKVDSEVLKGAMISKLEITQELGQHWWCDVELRLLDQQRPPVEAYIGKSLEFVTFDEAMSEVTLFDGFVLEGELEYELYGDFVAKLRAVTKSYLLQLTPEEDYFYKKTLREVAEKVVQEDGLALECNADGEMSRLNYVQWGETDFDFVKRIADDQGCFIRPTPRGIEIRRGFHDVGLTLRWHDEYGLLKFSLKGGVGQPACDGTCYDPRTMQSQTFRRVKKDPRFFPGAATEMVEAVRKQSEQLPSNRLVFDSRAPRLEGYQALLQKESARSIGSKFQASGLSREVHLRPGDQVHVEGMHFDAQGDYGLIRVVHRYDLAHGYRNEFTATPWMDYTSAEPPEPKRMTGVVPARVVNHNDPRGMGRIQIQYDWMEGASTGWTRMTTPHAGGGRGFMFMPEKGDEVLVAFEHGDPERPYVIGALWNSVDNAPRQGFWEDEGSEAVGNNSVQVPRDIARNDIKRIATKSGHRIQFVDAKDKESIVISTPGGQKIQLLDGCSETGGGKMLCLTSPGDIFLNAPNGRVHIRGKYSSREVG